MTTPASSCTIPKAGPSAREVIAGITGVLWADAVIAALEANGYEINMTYVERIRRAQSGLRP